MSKTHATPTISIPPDDLERVDRLAQRAGVSRSRFIREKIMPLVERAEREWSRVERQIEQLRTKDTEELEELENRLLTKDRSGDTSEAEKHLLGAVQQILGERAGVGQAPPIAEAA